MKLITYHPINDPYHAIFRLVSLLGHHDGGTFPLEQLRVLDFYLLFPSLLGDIRLTAELRKEYRSLSLADTLPTYQRLPDKRTLFLHVKESQVSAVRHLAATNIISTELLAEDVVSIRSAAAVPDRLWEMMDTAWHRSEHVYEFLLSGLASMEFWGRNGLKDRTRLLEYRYDA